MDACLIRHTSVNVPSGLCYGQHDVPLSDTFPQESKQVIKALPWIPHEIWTSPSQRCAQLATAIAESFSPQLKPIADPRLKELNFGQWENCQWNSFHDSTSNRWAEDPWNQRPPSGETGLEMWARISTLRNKLVARATPQHRIAIITHAGTIRIWNTLAKNQPHQQMSWASPIDFGGVYPAK